MPANHSYKNTFHTGRTIMERHQSSENLAIKPAKGLEVVEQGQRKWKVFLYACVRASGEEKQVIMQKAVEVGREKECYTLLTEGRATALHCREERTALHFRSVKGTNFRKFWLSHFPAYWGTPILGKSLWRPQWLQLHLGGKEWVQQSTPDTVRHLGGPSLE